MSNEENKRPSAKDLLDRLRTNTNSSRQVSPQSDGRTPDAEKKPDKTGSNPKPLSLEEFYGFEPLIDGKRSEVQKKKQSSTALKKPTRQKPVSKETKPKVTDTEYDLMSIFGMEEKDDSPTDLPTVDDIDDESEESDEREPILASRRKKREEYTDFSQNERISSEYRKRLMLSLADLALCLLLTFFVFCIEHSALLPFSMPSFLRVNVYPNVVAMLEVQLFVFAILLKYKDFLRGGANLFTGVSPESVMFLTTVLSALFYLIQIASHRQDFMFFGLVTMLSILMYTVCSLLMLFAEIRSFRIISSKKTKRALYRMTKDESRMEIAEMSRYLPYGNKYLCVKRAEKIGGFYKNTAARSKLGSWSGILLLISLLAAFGFGLYGYFSSGDAFMGIATGYVSYLMIMPLSVYLYYSYPLCHLSVRAEDHDSAVVGASALEGYMPPANITLCDADVFLSSGVKLDRIKLYGTMPYDKVLRYAATVLCPTGGPLGKVLESIFESDVIDDMEYLSVADDGIEAAVEGRHVLVGTYHYIVRNHLQMPADGDTPDRDAVNMYIAVDNDVTAKLELSYRPSDTFAKMLTMLFDSGMTVVIKTFDPNIDLPMLCSVLGIDEKLPIKVIHTNDPIESENVDETVDSPIVTLGGIRELMETLGACSKTRHAIGICMTLAVIAMLTGAVVMGVVLSMTALSGMPAYYLALYQLFWLIPGVVITKLFS